MKQTQTPLQADVSQNSFDNKLWQVERIRETFNGGPPNPDTYYIRKDVNIAGKTLIILIRRYNRWDSPIYLAMNKKGPNSDSLELWSGYDYMNVIKLEGFKAFSLFIPATYDNHYEIFIDLIYIDQTEDIDFNMQLANFP